MAGEDGARKRRLPVWMLKSSTETEAATSSCQSEPDRPQIETKPVKRKQRRNLSNQETECKPVESEILIQRCKTRLRNRRAGRRDTDRDETAIDETEIERDGEKEKENVKVVKWKKSSLRLKRNMKGRDCDTSSLVSTDDYNDDDDGIELTVDDLISIAEEYVNADKDKEKQTDYNSKVNASKAAQATESSKGLLKCSTSDSNNPLNEEKKKSEEEEGISVNIASTGDAAQDMLNLFFGPLLLKPTPTVKEVGVDTTEKISSNFEFKMSEKVVCREVIKVTGEERITKKKSSLKDKVALFLD